jgi:hypothetical protein
MVKANSRGIFVIALFAVAVAMSSCSSSTDSSAAPPQMGSVHPGIVTRACGQRVADTAVKPRIANLDHGPFLHLKASRLSTDTYRVSDSCNEGAVVNFTPTRCADVLTKARATNGGVVMMQIKQRCSYRIAIDGVQRASVKVSPPRTRIR